MKHFSTLIANFILMVSVSAYADFKSFSKADYDAALKSGATIVVDFHASWCPTCKKQEPILNEIVGMKGYEKVIALKADFDSEKDLKKSLNVSKQSTIVVFKNGKEVGRNIGITDKAELKKLIDMGL